MSTRRTLQLVSSLALGVILFAVPTKVGAAISFIDSCEGTLANGGDVTLTLPSMLENDLVIVAYSIGDDDTDHDMFVITADYNEAADLFSNDTDDANLGVYWKVMGSTPDTEVQVEGRGQTDSSVAAVCMVFRGVDTVTPMDVAVEPATGLNTMHPNPPSIDHNNPSGVWTVIAGSNSHLQSLGSTANPFTFPTGYTTNAVQIPGNDTTDTTVGMGYNSSPSDPEDPGTMTHSGTDSTGLAWAAVTMALRPAAPDSDPPTPDPPLFEDPAGLPTPASASSITASSTVATDAGSPPVRYYFGNINDDCGADAGTGGSDSGWQLSTLFTDTGLEPNKCYGYKLQLRDSASTINYTATSTMASTTYTHANIPSAPTISNVTQTTFKVTNNENSNPSENPTTEFALQIVNTTDPTWDDMYINQSGNPSATAVWLSDALWDGKLVTGLQTNVAYEVQAKARNANNIETAFSSTASLTSDAEEPTTGRGLQLTGGIRLFGTIRLF